MAIGTNIPVEEIETLARRIQNETNSLNDQLNSLRSACAREASFAGTSASAYDEFMQRWDSSQAGLLESLRGAATLLDGLAQRTREDDLRTASSFGG